MQQARGAKPIDVISAIDEARANLFDRLFSHMGGKNMFRPLVLCVIASVSMQGCADDPIRVEPEGDKKDYFSAARNCVQQSLRKEKIQVPCGQGNVAVEIPLSYDSTAFGRCMVKAGFSPAKIDPDAYLEIARKCLCESGSAPEPDAAYLNCVRRSGISVDVEIVHDPK